ncbi:MAG: methyltransferase domain-containing protein [Chloroflexi bacterium]|nr:methyltransferase domain-containing protein [Chloroflexota bacterium]
MTVESLLDAERQAHVDELEKAVIRWRREGGREPLSSEALPALPSGDAVAGDLEWRLRRHDLAVVRSELAGLKAELAGPRAELAGPRPLRILDFGSWNGWLSHRLTTDGHQLTAVDAFAGTWSLSAPWPTPPTWRRIQAEMTDLTRLGETFDVVIANRCLAFEPHPVTAMATLRRLVGPAGRLIATGLLVYGDAEKARLRLAAEAAAFRTRFGVDMLLRPTRGVLDRGDIADLAAAGLDIHATPGLRLANIRARFDPLRPAHRYGVA